MVSNRIIKKTKFFLLKYIKQKIKLLKNVPGLEAYLLFNATKLLRNY